MSALDDRLAALEALGRETPIEIKEGRMRFQPVVHSRELDRILALPLRPAGGFSEAAREALRAAVTRPGAEYRLWDIQCDALLAALDAYDASSEEQDRSGLFASISVGKGKTLVAGLLGTVWGLRRVLVLTQATLVPQTRALLTRYRASFVLPEELLVAAYTDLSKADQADFLEALDPEAVVVDEAQHFRNKASARGRRLRRWKRRHPERPLANLTGSPARTSVTDVGELADLALGARSPLPRDFPTMREWAQALDLPDGRGPLRAVGALASLAGGPGVSRNQVLAALAERLARCPGCVATQGEDDVDVELEVRVLRDPRPPAINAARNALDATWARPDGEELMLATEHAEVDRQLRLGGWYGWETEPDREWLAARRAYRRAVREWIARHPGAIDRELDTPLAVESAILRGWLPAFPEWVAWSAIKDRAEEPPRIWRWVDEGVARYWRDRLWATSTPTVAFGYRKTFLARVAELAGLPLYGAGRKAAEQLARDEDGSRSIALSLGAHKTGKNLQAYSRAILFDPPPSGEDWEQVLGRLHRPGQLRQRVVYELTDEWLVELGKAQARAEWASKATGAPKKLQGVVITRES